MCLFITLLRCDVTGQVERADLNLSQCMQNYYSQKYIGSSTAQIWSSCTITKLTNAPPQILHTSATNGCDNRPSEVGLGQIGRTVSRSQSKTLFRQTEHKVTSG